ncbi:proline iminopeptidase-family hydrolase [Nocardioides sp. LHD-245]|uniref:proline iminopeptidase-family hydrolase n=1 Tax=Nocardioides sp. LHD-245 TaxID=3051387 RepID=UPI0027E0782B|nr:proline iminopeptidase-family hydrolase [Nocardioides sp. LHD-245]
MDVSRAELAAVARRCFDSAPALASQGHLDLGGSLLWYGVVGHRDDRPPIVCVHGGPGGVSHEVLWPLAALALTGRRVVFFDQLGCGRSTREVDVDALGIHSYVAQVRAVIDGLGLGRCHVLGHSFGGMVTQEIALSDPGRLRSVVLADTSSDLDRYLAEGEAIRQRLPPDIRELLETGDQRLPGHADAYRTYLEQFSCRLRPVPLALRRARDGGNDSVTEAMWGPGGQTFAVTGRLGGWTCLERLPQLSVPALVITGEHDIASPALVALSARAIPSAALHVVAGGSHTPFFDDPGDFLEVVAAFLSRHDGDGGTD